VYLWCKSALVFYRFADRVGQGIQPNPIEPKRRKDKKPKHFYLLVYYCTTKTQFAKRL
jgi:hypothetical protein